VGRRGWEKKGRRGRVKGGESGDGIEWNGEGKGARCKERGKAKVGRGCSVNEKGLGGDREKGLS